MIELLAILIVFGSYFYFIDPMIQESIGLKFLIFMLVYMTLHILFKKFDGRFEFFERRIDKQLSVWIVAGLVIIVLVMGVL